MSASSSTTPRSPLLALPREIRDRIISFVPQLRSPSLPATAAIHPDAFLPVGEISSKRLMMRSRISYAKHVPNPLLPLLLTNQQLHAETVSFIRRQARRGPAPDYDVDLYYLKNVSFWLRWTRVPALPPAPRTADFVVDTLHCRWHLAECPEALGLDAETEQTNRNAFLRGGCGGPPAIIWMLFGLLESAMEKGPFGFLGWPGTGTHILEGGDASGGEDAGVSSRGKEAEGTKRSLSESRVRRHAKGICVRRLILDVQVPSGPSVLPLGLVERYGRKEDFFSMWIRRAKVLAGKLPRARDGPIPKPTPAEENRAAAEGMAVFLTEWLEALSGMYYDDLYKSGKVLYERVGVLEIWVDGVETKKFDLGSVLPFRPPEKRFYNNERAEALRPQVEAWKAETLERRKRLGLDESVL